jgi:hypothetical protein
VNVQSIDRPLFDEKWYLERYPDVAAAVASGRSPSAIAHYVDHGKDEGRLGYQFDKTWYHQSYPMVERDIRAGRAADAPTHYELIGRYRGYLPHANAPRPDNPVAPYSRFGGLWTDWTDAADRVYGRLEVGLITQFQAQQLLAFMRDGYIVIKDAIPEELLVRARHDLDKAYLGGFRNLLFECRNVSEKLGAWNPRMNEFPAKALDVHWFSPDIRSLIFAPKITAFLHVLFESRPLASQSLGFLRGSAEPPHQDSAYVPYTLQRNFVASWIALEDVEEGAGELVYFPGGHRLPDFLYSGDCKSVSEAQRTGAPGEYVSTDVARHARELPARCRTSGSSEQKFLANRGDILIWHADLPHSTKQVSSARTRKSVMTHYSPGQVAPLYLEGRRLSLHDHSGMGHYASCYYGSEERL